jgi:hypothetical protein
MIVIHLRSGYNRISFWTDNGDRQSSSLVFQDGPHLPRITKRLARLRPGTDRVHPTTGAAYFLVAFRGKSRSPRISEGTLTFFQVCLNRRTVFALQPGTTMFPEWPSFVVSKWIQERLLHDHALVTPSEKPYRQRISHSNRPHAISRLLLRVT